MPRSSAATPAETLSTADVVAIVVGVVIGAGIFRTPTFVAQNVGSAGALLGAWLLGGGVSFIGALCYAELASAYPNAGGDYHYLRRALGDGVAFLFAWARLVVIQTGTIALPAFVFGDYATELWSLGPYSPSIYAAAAVALLTTTNAVGVRIGATAQRWLTWGTIGGLLVIVGAGLFLVPASAGQPPAPSAPAGQFGGAMVFVLLTYGGWNEAAYVSAELRDVGRNMVRALLISIGLIAGLYLLVNGAYVNGLGLGGMSGSDVVAADLMNTAFGTPGAQLLSLLVVVATLSSTNATIFTGARTVFALGRDFSMFSWLGTWRDSTNTPVHALLAQGGIALLLVGVGAATRQGFETMVDYTAPVFWTFFLLTGVSLFVLRRRDPERERPFRIPLYPFTPLLFCGAAAYMLWSSLAYTGVGALLGVGVLLAGLPLLLLHNSQTTD